MPGRHGQQAQHDLVFVAYKVVQTPDFGGTATGKSLQLTLGMQTPLDGMLINACKLVAYFIDSETG